MAKALLAWYRANARALPWRGSADPYAIWISEIMLQQTRVETVLPYYARWMRRFPTADSVADARLDEILQLWEGLGYYRRAVNLHRAARVLVEQHGGQLPGTLEELRRLPGVGHYTAAAIASLAFGQDVVALDGNLRRVLARYDLELDLRYGAGEQPSRAPSPAGAPAGKSADFNQALWTWRPRCTRRLRLRACPLRPGCRRSSVGAGGPACPQPASSTAPAAVGRGVVLRNGAALLVRRESGSAAGRPVGISRRASGGRARRARLR
jgi:A/G-specific adenine glycosylase